MAIGECWIKSGMTNANENINERAKRFPKFAIRHSKFLADAINRIRQMRFPAAGAAAGSCQAPPVLENKSAVQTFARPDNKSAALGRQRAVNVGQMFIYFFFPDPHLPRQLPGIHFSFRQQRDYFLANGRHCYMGEVMEWWSGQLQIPNLKQISKSKFKIPDRYLVEQSSVYYHIVCHSCESRIPHRFRNPQFLIILLNTGQTRTRLKIIRCFYPPLISSLSRQQAILYSGVPSSR